MATRPRRAQSSRAAVQRPHPQAGYRGRLFIDPHKVPKDKVYAWIRETVLNEPDDNNVSERMIGGWEPVPIDRHPELVPPQLPGRPNPMEAGVIRRGGLILMEMHKALYKEYREGRRVENEEIMKSVAWTSGELNDDPRMPFTADRENIVQIERETVFKD